MKLVAEVSECKSGYRTGYCDTFVKLFFERGKELRLPCHNSYPGVLPATEYEILLRPNGISCKLMNSLETWGTST